VVLTSTSPAQPTSGRTDQRAVEETAAWCCVCALGTVLVANVSIGAAHCHPLHVPGLSLGLSAPLQITDRLFVASLIPWLNAPRTSILMTRCDLWPVVFRSQHSVQRRCPYCPAPMTVPPANGSGLLLFDCCHPTNRPWVDGTPCKMHSLWHRTTRVYP